MALDAAQGGGDYAAALRRPRPGWPDSSLTAVGACWPPCRGQHGRRYEAFSPAQSPGRRTSGYRPRPTDAAQQQHYEALAAQSLAAQSRIEDADTLPFEDWRQQYMDPRQLGLELAGLRNGS